MQITKLVKTIKNYSITKNKTAICFLGYFTLFNMKSILLRENKINEKDFYKYLERPLTLSENKDCFILKDKTIRNSFKLNNINEVLISIQKYLEYYKNFDNELYMRVSHNWEELGLRELKNEFSSNKNGLNKIIEEFDKIDNFSIKDLIDLFEQLNVSDRFYNDYFTPNSISILMTRILLVNDFTNKPHINICDHACGIGRLLYHCFINLKEKYPDKDINVFGIDICDRFAIFTSSIFSLINFNHTFIEVANTITEDFTDTFPEFDLIVNNPPFGNIKHSQIIKTRYSA